MGAFFPLVEIDCGQVFRFSDRSLRVPCARKNRTLDFVGGTRVDSVPGIGENDGAAAITIATSLLDVQALRAAQCPLGGAEARVSLWEEGTDYDTAIPVVVGRVRPQSERRYRWWTSFELGTLEGASDPPFPAATLTLAGFPYLDVGQFGRTIPAIYGTPENVTLIPDRPLVEGLSVRWIIACHQLSAGTLLCYKNGTGDALNLTVKYAAGPVFYAYVETTSDQTYGTTSLVAASVPGKPGPDGLPITGLGDVVVDLIRSYALLTADRTDEQRLARFQAQANRIPVASVFGGQSSGETLIATIKSRYEATLPMLLSWRGGRLGADWLGYDELAPHGPTLVFGADYTDFQWPLVTTGAQFYTDFAADYDVHLLTRVFQRRATLGPTDDARLARAVSRNIAAGIPGGRNAYPPMRMVDLSDGAAVGVALRTRIERESIPRTTVTLQGRTDVLGRLPLLEVYPITDPRVGWSAEPFRLERIGFPKASELTFCTATLTSVREAP